MELGNTLSEYFSNMLGNVEKAIIKVIDDGDGSGDDHVRLEESPDVSTGMQNMMSNAYTGIENIQVSSIKELAQMHADTEKLFAKGKQFTVQFNPSTLKLRASGGGRSEIKNFSRSTEDNTKNPIGYSYQSLPFSIFMDVDLIFNKVDPNDAFLELAPSLGTLKGAIKSGANLIGKNASYSVQNEVEGLIAATRCFRTCLLSFNWGKLCYSGVLQNLESTYTVFNPKGEPVAGTVHLNMILIDEYVNERNMGKWYRAYQTAFKDAGSLGTAVASFGGSAFTNFTF